MHDASCLPKDLLTGVAQLVLRAGTSRILPTTIIVLGRVVPAKVGCNKVIAKRLVNDKVCGVHIMLKVWVTCVWLDL